MTELENRARELGEQEKLVISDTLSKELELKAQKELRALKEE